MTTATKETMEFQAEAKQLLQLMTHSLYSNKEIFLRELISNASDACDKLRFEAISRPELLKSDAELAIRVDVDEKKRLITVSDNGIGMTRDEIIENIGTIARSGTKKFLEALTESQSKDTNLIGQFGVGFYSAFIVADKVTVISRKAGEDPSQGVCWTSEGTGTFTVEPINKESRGTDIILHLKKDEKEFLDGFRLRSIIHKYSDHISLPIIMKKTEKVKKEDSDETETVVVDETVNKASALWTRSKKDISDEEYKEFYRHISHDFGEPLTYTHNQVEGKLSYTSLLYIPKTAPFDLWDREQAHGVKLYVRRVFIMDDAKELLPTYMRFVKGVVDTDDLPLNVSREILQQSPIVDKLRNACVKRVLDMLGKLAKKKDSSDYQTFWKEFGRVLKEGIVEDHANKDKIAKLLRFSSTFEDKEEQTVSLDDYIERMKEGQDKIYYLTGESFAAVKSSPHLEIFRKKGVEVLLLSDRIDEWLTSSLTEYEGKPLQSVAKGNLELDKICGKNGEKKEEKKTDPEEHKAIIEKMKEALGDRAKEVRASVRLTDSPSCIVVDEHEMSPHLKKIMQAAGQTMPDTKPILEVNLDHPLVKVMEKDEDRMTDWANFLFDQAMLRETGQLDDPGTFSTRLNDLLLKLTEDKQ
ncbi:MAG: molecular chaperone HtpG [Gammaproteobacteria bacterium]|nr:MAG: molecular chaperone HtpG [Gammaproteobacteria bacterium]